MRFSDGSSSNKIMDTPIFNLVDLVMHSSHTDGVMSVVWNSLLSHACDTTKEALPAGCGKYRSGCLCEHGPHVPHGDMGNYMTAEFMQVDDSLS